MRFSFQALAAEYEIVRGDWSSDVCSSDLGLRLRLIGQPRHREGAQKRQKDEPPPGLAHQPKGQEVAKFMNEKCCYNEAGNYPAHHEPKGHEAQKPGDKGDACGNKRVGFFVGFAGFGQAFQAVSSAPEIGAGENLGNEGAWPPVIT